jgi:hypothetical protein
VRPEAARADFVWTQREAKKLVWASGCTSWAVDPKTGLNNMMYPDWQFAFWLRSIFWKKNDFVYLDEQTGREVQPGEATRMLMWTGVAGTLIGAFVGRDWLLELPGRLGNFDIGAVSNLASRYIGEMV